MVVLSLPKPSACQLIAASTKQMAANANQTISTNRFMWQIYIHCMVHEMQKLLIVAKDTFIEHGTLYCIVHDNAYIFA